MTTLSRPCRGWRKTMPPMWASEAAIWHIEMKMELLNQVERKTQKNSMLHIMNNFEGLTSAHPAPARHCWTKSH